MPAFRLLLFRQCAEVSTKQMWPSMLCTSPNLSPRGLWKERILSAANPFIHPARPWSTVAALSIDTIGPAASLAPLAAGVPLIALARAVGKPTPSIWVGRSCASRAWHGVKWLVVTEAALHMNGISIASQHPHAAQGVPIVRRDRLVGKGAG